MRDVWDDLADVARSGRRVWLDETRSTEQSVDAERRRARSMVDVCGEWMMAGHRLHAAWGTREVVGRIVAALRDVVVVDDSPVLWGLRADMVSTWARGDETVGEPFAGVRLWPSWNAWVMAVASSESPSTVHLLDGQTRRGERIEQAADHLIVHHRDGSETMAAIGQVVSVSVPDRDSLIGW